MAPRRRRSKVGLGRMDAALDAMRPMGFPADAVRKSVKKLLKVYGDGGWPFIEEAAYKLLIDTILEEPEGDQLGHETGLSPPESCSKGSLEQPASGNELSDKAATYDEHEEPLPPVQSCSKGSLKQPASGKELCDEVATYDELVELPIYCQEVKLEGENIEGRDSGFEDVEEHEEMGVGVDLGPAYVPQPVSRVPTGGQRRPCYGWISDEDEDDEMVELAPSTSSLQMLLHEEKLSR
ncbi:probable inactive histone-lysine N-methyltransferase SUVR1 [Salvia miltiorrhiza]|uniref:probable inactive histone-lysine N-methyltransferase SUVR1 n=1 Tax=Salvia miltiorrhiza TaxID=226208 RepID=UPI0025ABE3FC|nr:probable inactive histone-lysine N-methyltransferase SUVR1 [Salvia miltiorrhiza]XP_057788907.1 probable inactive histone-lysine N-methyltransferase SUVR1 [Salvia miltiorrhiza]